MKKFFLLMAISVFAFNCDDDNNRSGGCSFFAEVVSLRGLAACPDYGIKLLTGPDEGRIFIPVLKPEYQKASSSSFPQFEYGTQLSLDYTPVDSARYTACGIQHALITCLGGVRADSVYRPNSPEPRFHPGN